MVNKYLDAARKWPRPPGRTIQGKMFVKDEGYFKSFQLKPRVVMEACNLEQIIPIAPFCSAVSDYWHY